MTAFKGLSPRSRQHFLFSLTLISLLAGVYVLTYRGFPISLDEVALFSSTESLVKYGEFNLVSLYHEYPVAGDLYLLETPWAEPVHEPLQTILAVPLYWLAQHIKPIGLLHTVWLFNIGVMIGIALVLYWGGVALGYSPAASWWTAVLLGVASMLLPYSQTFFREPLLAFFQLIVIVLAFKLRQRWRWRLAGVMGVIGLAAFVTKSVMLLTMPTLVLILFPDVKQTMQRSLLWRLVVIGGIGAVIVIAAGYLVTRVLPANYRFDYIGYEERVEQSNFAYARTVIGAYLFSPGRSLWATSPVLLLSFYGAWLAYRAGRLRLALAPFLLFLSVTLGYSVGGWDWHGGRGWGTRYLLHVIPIMGLLLLPVLHAYFEGKIARRWQLLVLMVIAFSVVVQLAGVLVPISQYYAALSAQFPDDPINAFYGRGTWDVRYTQWYVNLRALSLNDLDVAWSYADPFWRGPLVGGLLIGVGAALVWHYKRSREPLSVYWLGLGTGAVFLLMTLGCGFALNSLERDQRILADRPELHQLLAQVEAKVQPEDILFLSDPEYRDFFLNFYKGRARLVVLPYAPGERYSFEQKLLVETKNPDERLDVKITLPLEYAANQYRTIWLVSNLSPFQPWAFRPVEEYLARHFYPVEEVYIAPNARLIRFFTLPAPSYDYVYKTLYITRREPFYFGDSIVLNGYDLPQKVEAGAVLPISLRWERIGAVDFDYNVGVFLVNSEGLLVASRNGQPQGTFGYTSRWALGVPQGDNHGLLIPADLPVGEYAVQVVMYDWRDAARLPVSQNDERIAGDYAEIARIEVTSP